MSASRPQALQGIRILSLALNLPGPAALMRCRQMGADCLKLEPPSGDPMGSYNPSAYAEMHEGVQIGTVDLKSAAGQDRLHQALAQTDILLSSFRPSAMDKLGLGWPALRARYPALSHVAIVGAPGARAEEPGHDLTYLAANGLVPGLELPATLYADMGGSLLAVEAVLQAALHRFRGAGAGQPPAPGLYLEVALSEAARYLALPRSWGLTLPRGAVGGAHAGYGVYACQDGRVAVAALEPHFAARLFEAAGLPAGDLRGMFTPAMHEGVAAFFAARTRAEIDQLAAERDLPLHTMV